MTTPTQAQTSYYSSFTGFVYEHKKEILITAAVVGTGGAAVAYIGPAVIASGVASTAATATGGAAGLAATTATAAKGAIASVGVALKGATVGKLSAGVLGAAGLAATKAASQDSEEDEDSFTNTARNTAKTAATGMAKKIIFGLGVGVGLAFGEATKPFSRVRTYFSGSKVQNEKAPFDEKVRQATSNRKEAEQRIAKDRTNTEGFESNATQFDEQIISNDRVLATFGVNR